MRCRISVLQTLALANALFVATALSQQVESQVHSLTGQIQGVTDANDPTMTLRDSLRGVLRGLATPIDVKIVGQFDDLKGGFNIEATNKAMRLTFRFVLPVQPRRVAFVRERLAKTAVAYFDIARGLEAYKIEYKVAATVYTLNLGIKLPLVPDKSVTLEEFSLPTNAWEAGEDRSEETFGRMRFSQSRRNIGMITNQGEVTVWSAADGIIKARFPGSPPFTTFDFDRGDSLLAAGQQDGSSVLISLNTGRVIRTLPKTPDEVSAICFGSDNTLVAIGDDDYTVMAVNASEGNTVKSHDFGAMDVKRLFFDSTNRRVISFAATAARLVLGSWAGISVLDLGTGEPKVVPEGSGESFLSASAGVGQTMFAAVSYSAGGLVGGRASAISVWDSSFGSTITLTSNARVSSLDVHPTRPYIVSSDYNSVKIWDVAGRSIFEQFEQTAPIIERVWFGAQHGVWYGIGKDGVLRRVRWNESGP